LKHKLVLTDEELDSIRASLGQVMTKGTVIPDLVRLDYKLEKLRQAKPRIKKARESIEKASAEPQEVIIIENTSAKPRGPMIRIVNDKAR
jgi:hypothetical protein